MPHWNSSLLPLHDVAKRERGHPTRTRTRVYRVPNMHSDCNAKEHGSQSTYSSVVTALRHAALPFGKSTHVHHAHRHPSRITQPYFSHPRVPHTLVLHPSLGSLTQGSTYLG